MPDPPSHLVTGLLEAVAAGDSEAEDRLVPLIYSELRKMARGLMAKEEEGQTLQPTAVVHEVYIRLLAGSSPSWNSRAHFFGAAAQAMRRLLIDQARRKARLKRGGDRERVTLEEDALFCEPRPEALLALDAALTRLEDLDPKMAKVVNLRYYAGLTIEETAQALETSHFECAEKGVRSRAHHPQRTPEPRIRT